MAGMATSWHPEKPDQATYTYSLLAAVFCVGHIVPSQKRLLNRAEHAIPIV